MTPSLGRGKFAPRPNRLPVSIEQKWRWNESDAQKCQQAGRPWYAEIVIHWGREKREASARDGTNECVGGNG